MNGKNHRVENIAVDHCGICRFYNKHSMRQCSHIPYSNVDAHTGACKDFELDQSCSVEEPKPAEDECCNKCSESRKKHFIRTDPNPAEPTRFCYECWWMKKSTLYCAMFNFVTNYGQEIPVRDGNPCEHFRDCSPHEQHEQQGGEQMSYGTNEDIYSFLSNVRSKKTRDARRTVIQRCNLHFYSGTKNACEHCCYDSASGCSQADLISEYDEYLRKHGKL